MTIPNQKWFSLGGEPLGARMSPRLVVSGGEITGPQLAEVTHLFSLFTTAVNNSSFPGGYHMSRRKLTDGSDVKFESISGQQYIRVQVYPREVDNVPVHAIGLYFTDMSGAPITGWTQTLDSNEIPQGVWLIPGHTKDGEERVSDGSWNVKKVDRVIGGNVLWVNESRTLWFSSFRQTGGDSYLFSFWTQQSFWYSGGSVYLKSGNKIMKTGGRVVNNTSPAYIKQYSYIMHQGVTVALKGAQGEGQVFANGDGIGYLNANSSAATLYQFKLPEDRTLLEAKEEADLVAADFIDTAVTSFSPGFGKGIGEGGVSVHPNGRLAIASDTDEGYMAINLIEQTSTYVVPAQTPITSPEGATNTDVYSYTRLPIAVDTSGPFGVYQILNSEPYSYVRDSVWETTRSDFGSQFRAAFYALNGDTVESKVEYSGSQSVRWERHETDDRIFAGLTQTGWDFTGTWDYHRVYKPHTSVVFPKRTIKTDEWNTDYTVAAVGEKHAGSAAASSVDGVYTLTMSGQYERTTRTILFYDHVLDAAVILENRIYTDAAYTVSGNRAAVTASPQPAAASHTITLKVLHRAEQALSAPITAQPVTGSISFTNILGTDTWQGLGDYPDAGGSSPLYINTPGSLNYIAGYDTQTGTPNNATYEWVDQLWNTPPSTFTYSASVGATSTTNPAPYFNVRAARDPVTLALILHIWFKGAAYGHGNTDKTWFLAVDHKGVKTVQSILKDGNGTPMSDTQMLLPWDSESFHSLVSI